MLARGGGEAGGWLVSVSAVPERAGSMARAMSRAAARATSAQLSACTRRRSEASPLDHSSSRTQRSEWVTRALIARGCARTDSGAAPMWAVTTASTSCCVGQVEGAVHSRASCTGSAGDAAAHRIAARPARPTDILCRQAMMVAFLPQEVSWLSLIFSTPPDTASAAGVAASCGADVPHGGPYADTVPPSFTAHAAQRRLWIGLCQEVTS